MQKIYNRGIKSISILLWAILIYFWCVFLQSPAQLISESVKIQRFTQNFVGEGRRGKIQALYQLLKWMTKWRRWILIEHLARVTRVDHHHVGLTTKLIMTLPLIWTNAKWTMNYLHMWSLPTCVTRTQMQKGICMTSLSSVCTLPLVRSEMQLRVWMFPVWISTIYSLYTPPFWLPLKQKYIDSGFQV